MIDPVMPVVEFVYPTARQAWQLSEIEEPGPDQVSTGCGAFRRRVETLESLFTESLILAQDERWRRA